jgi:hypothetical protein
MNNTIEETIKNILVRVPPSSGDELVGMLIDADHYLTEHMNFSNATVKTTQNPACLLTADVVISDDTSTLQEVYQALLDVWASIGYTNFQASSVFMCKDATILRFVTVISSDAFCVTGRFKASGPKYSQLVAEFEKTFGSISGPLESMSELGV